MQAGIDAEDFSGEFVASRPEGFGHFMSVASLALS